MFKYPYGNLHGLNLDWLIDQWKKFQSSFTGSFTASSETLPPTDAPNVNVTYDQNTGEYDFHFGLPTGVKPTGFEIGYQASASGTTIPTGAWLATPPAVPSGEYLWSRTRVLYNDNQFSQTYAVSRQGVDGAGSPATTEPLMDGVVDIGSSLAFARADHVHPSDTSKINASALSSATPQMNGIGASGTSTDVARADHVHPTDTTRLPTSALSSTPPLMDGVANSGSSTNVSRSDHVHPTDTSRLAVSALSDSTPQMDWESGGSGTSATVSRSDHFHPSDNTKLDTKAQTVGHIDFGKYYGTDGALVTYKDYYVAEIPVLETSMHIKILNSADNTGTASVFKDPFNNILGSPIVGRGGGNKGFANYEQVPAGACKLCVTMYNTDRHVYADITYM